MSIDWPPRKCRMLTPRSNPSRLTLMKSSAEPWNQVAIMRPSSCQTLRKRSQSPASRHTAQFSMRSRMASRSSSGTQESYLGRTMPSIDLTRRAIHAAAACARRLGVRVDEPLLLHDASNVLVHLRPAPLVARVATTTAMSRDGGGEHLAREVAIAGRLARAGAPVIPPSGEVDPGPHTEDGLALSFWELAERVPGPPSPAAAGRALRECHEALAATELELPPLEALHEAVRMLDMPVAAQAFGADDMAMLRTGL